MSKKGFVGCLAEPGTIASSAIGVAVGAPGLTASMAAARGAISHEAAEAMEEAAIGKGNSA